MPSVGSVFVKHKVGQDHFQLYNLHRTQVYVALVIESTYGLSSDFLLPFFYNLIYRHNNTTVSRLHNHIHSYYLYH